MPKPLQREPTSEELIQAAFDAQRFDPSQKENLTPELFVTESPRSQAISDGKAVPMMQQPTTRKTYPPPTIVVTVAGDGQGAKDLGANVEEHVEKQSPEKKSSEKRPSEKRSPAKKLSERKLSEKKSLEKKSSETQLSEKQQPSKRTKKPKAPSKAARQLDQIVEKRSHSMACCPSRLVRRVKSHPVTLGFTSTWFSDIDEKKEPESPTSQESVPPLPVPSTSALDLPTHLPKNDVPPEPVADPVKKKQRVDTVDVDVREEEPPAEGKQAVPGGEVVRTVIRHANKVSSRPTSPVSSVLRGLDCSSTTSFEKQLDVAQRQRTVSAKSSSLVVKVEKDVLLTRSPVWGHPADQLFCRLEGRPEPDAISVSSQVEVLPLPKKPEPMKIPKSIL